MCCTVLNLFNSTHTLFLFAFIFFYTVFPPLAPEIRPQPPQQKTVVMVHFLLQAYDSHSGLMGLTC